MSSAASYRWKRFQAYYLSLWDSIKTNCPSSIRVFSEHAWPILMIFAGMIHKFSSSLYKVELLLRVSPGLLLWVLCGMRAGTWAAVTGKEIYIKGVDQDHTSSNPLSIMPEKREKWLLSRDLCCALAAGKYAYRSDLFFELIYQRDIACDEDHLALMPSQEQIYQQRCAFLKEYADKLGEPYEVLEESLARLHQETSTYFQRMKSDLQTKKPEKAFLPSGWQNIHLLKAKLTRICGEVPPFYMSDNVDESDSTNEDDIIESLQTYKMKSSCLRMMMQFVKQLHYVDNEKCWVGNFEAMESFLSEESSIMGYDSKASQEFRELWTLFCRQECDSLSGGKIVDNKTFKYFPENSKDHPFSDKKLAGYKQNLSDISEVTDAIYVDLHQINPSLFRFKRCLKAKQIEDVGLLPFEGIDAKCNGLNIEFLAVVALFMFDVREVLREQLKTIQRASLSTLSVYHVLEWSDIRAIKCQFMSIFTEANDINYFYKHFKLVVEDQLENAKGYAKRYPDIDLKKEKDRLASEKRARQTEKAWLDVLLKIASSARRTREVGVGYKGLLEPEQVNNREVAKLTKHFPRDNCPGIENEIACLLKRVHACYQSKKGIIQEQTRRLVRPADRGAYYKTRLTLDLKLMSDSYSLLKSTWARWFSQLAIYVIIANVLVFGGVACLGGWSILGAISFINMPLRITGTMMIMASCVYGTLTFAAMKIYAGCYGIGEALDGEWYYFNYGFLQKNVGKMAFLCLLVFGLVCVTTPFLFSKTIEFVFDIGQGMIFLCNYLGISLAWYTHATGAVGSLFLVCPYVLSVLLVTLATIASIMVLYKQVQKAVIFDSKRFPNLCSLKTMKSHGFFGVLVYLIGIPFGLALAAVSAYTSMAGDSAGWKNYVSEVWGSFHFAIQIVSGVGNFFYSCVDTMNQTVGLTLFLGLQFYILLGATVKGFINLFQPVQANREDVFASYNHEVAAIRQELNPTFKSTFTPTPTPTPTSTPTPTPTPKHTVTSYGDLIARLDLTSLKTQRKSSPCSLSFRSIRESGTVTPVSSPITKHPLSGICVELSSTVEASRAKTLSSRKRTLRLFAPGERFSPRTKREEKLFEFSKEMYDPTAEAENCFPALPTSFGKK